MSGSPFQTLYQINNLSMEYQARQVLDIRQLSIYAGEILAIVGPSGAGKSTLLRILNFLEAPTDGEVVFSGNSFTASSDMPLTARRRVTTVFQRPMLLDRTVFENVAYGLKLRGQKNGKDRILATLEAVGLAGLDQQAARTLSGGEAQRVALARALVLEPKVLLLDEPTANLDPYNVALLEEIIRTSNHQSGTTMVLVTHNVFQARRLAHRVAFLLEGRLVEVADTESFFEDPRDPRTAAFVQGDMVY
ncbi:MAG: phosphate ABC transporter ATP-binding protein [Anaerolineales bacterium]|jgi:tungstate transport system ATP-binding protein